MGHGTALAQPATFNDLSDRRERLLDIFTRGEDATHVDGELILQTDRVPKPSVHGAAKGDALTP